MRSTQRRDRVRRRLRCLNTFLIRAGKDRLGRGARVIEYAIDVLKYTDIALCILLAFILYLIDVDYLKVPVGVGFALLLSPIFLAFLLLDLWIIKGFVSLVLGLKRLADVLPALINGSEPPKDVPKCMVEYFRGDAAEVLSKVYKYLLPILYLYLLAIPGTLLTAYMAIPLAGYSAVSLKAYAEFVDNVVTKTTINTALGILGIILTITFSIGSLFIRGRADASSFISDVRFFMFEQFVFAIFIIALSMAIPPVYAISSSVPLILAITIDLVAYLMLAITVIEHT
jgi:hypothetical protein